MTSTMNDWALAIGLATLFASCGAEPTADVAPNVVLVCMDTVRADHLGCYGYDDRDTTPFLDALAAESLRFSDASATACWTKPSVPSILTGTMPMQHGVYRGSARDEAGTFSDVLPDEAKTLAEAFHERGYQTGAFIKNSQLRPGLGFEQGFDVYKDKAGDAREIRWRANDWLDDRDEARPFFLYLHYLDAHWPYPIPDEYAGKFSEMEIVERIRSGDWRALRDAVNHGETELSAEDLGALLALYDGAIRYIDDELARLWKRLEREGLAENTILCVMADHGEEFLEHGKLGHGHGLYENLLDVPWILHVPGTPASVIESRVSLLDLYPTLLSAAGIETEMEGLLGVNRMHSPTKNVASLAEHLESKRYHVSWSQEGEKVVEIVTPKRGGSDAPRKLEELDTRGRWEVRLRPAEPGARMVSRLRPAKDQEEDEVEVKGLIEDVSATSFTIAGISIDTSATPEIYGAIEDEHGEERGILAGILVKARGTVRDGNLLARKIKLYPVGDEVEIEVRGLLSVTGANGIEVGGFTARVDSDSELDIGDGVHDLGAAEIAALMGEELAVEKREVMHYELAHDPEERAPTMGGKGIFEDAERLRLLNSFLATKLWGVQTKKRLSEDELKDLRAIGYAE